MAIFTITRNNTSLLSSPLTVNLTVGGTATFGTDYTVSGADTFTSTTATITIPAGQLSADITVTPTPDLVFEPDETVILSIVSSVGVSQLGTNPSATFTILNDDPDDSNVVLLMPMTTATGITDIKGKTTINSGASISTAISNPFGQNTGVLYFPGSGARISIAQSADFAFGSGAFAIDGWLYLTAIPAGVTWGFMDTRPMADLSNWVIAGNSSGKIGFTDFSYPSPYYEFGSTGLTLNQWQYFCFSRTATSTDKHKLWINGVLITTATTRNNSISAASPLLIGDRQDVSAPYDGSFTGYMSNIRIARSYRDGSIVPTAPFPTN